MSLALTFVNTWLTYIMFPGNPIQHAVPVFGFVLLVFFALFITGLLAVR